MTNYLTSFSVSKFYDLLKIIIRREIKFLTSTCLLKRAFCGVICISGGFQAASISEVSLTLRSKVFPAVRSLYKASACRATNVSCGKTIHCMKQQIYRTLCVLIHVPLNWRYMYWLIINQYGLSLRPFAWFPRRTVFLWIGQLHDYVILLQLPESLSLLFSCEN